MTASAHSQPVRATQPRLLDRDRDGLVPGGGAATVILESYESAVKRGAPIIAEVLAYGFSSNGDHISVPNVDGPSRSLCMAIKEAGIDIREIGYVNAHATSTPVGDRNEAKAIAAKVSIIRLIHSIWVMVSGNSVPMKAPNSTNSRAATFTMSWKKIKRWMFL